MERILVIKLGALGDIVQAEGAIHDLRLHHPEAEISVLTTPPYEKLLSRCPWLDRVLIDPRDSRFRLDRMARLGRMLKRQGFDRVYDLQQVGRTGFYYRLFFRKTPWLGGVKGCSDYLRRPDEQCAADHFRNSFLRAGIMAENCLVSDVGWMGDDVTDILSNHSLDSGYTVLIPGCSNQHPQKRWPGYGELAQYLIDQGQSVVTVPGPDEMELCEGIPGIMLTEQGRFLDYFQLAGVLKKAGFVVGNDTGPTHIAAHLRCSGLALFSDHTPPEHTGIQHSRFTWLMSDRLAELRVEQVIEKVVELRRNL